MGASSYRQSKVRHITVIYVSLPPPFDWSLFTAALSLQHRLWLLQFQQEDHYIFLTIIMHFWWYFKRNSIPVSSEIFDLRDAEGWPKSHCLSNTRINNMLDFVSISIMQNAFGWMFQVTVYNVLVWVKADVTMEVIELLQHAEWEECAEPLKDWTQRCNSHEGSAETIFICHTVVSCGLSSPANLESQFLQITVGPPCHHPSVPVTNHRLTHCFSAY